jgi:hypothetical protein
MGKYGDGVNYAKTLDPKSDSIMDPGTIGGKVRVMQDYFTFPASTTMVSDNYIVVGRELPLGSQVVSIALSNGAVGTGTDSYLCVGDEGDVDRYITLVQSTTAAVTTSINNYAGINYIVTGTTDNYIRVTGSGSTVCINSGGTIKVSIMYIVE